MDEFLSYPQLQYTGDSVFLMFVTLELFQKQKCYPASRDLSYRHEEKRVILYLLVLQNQVSILLNGSTFHIIQQKNK